METDRVQFGEIKEEFWKIESTDSREEGSYP